MKARINVSSKQFMHKSTKIRNTPTSSTHIVMKIMQDIFMEVTMSPQHLSYSMLPSFNGEPRNNMRYIEAVTMKKQQQCTQYYCIKIGSETYIDQLVTP